MVGQDFNPLPQAAIVRRLALDLWVMYLPQKGQSRISCCWPGQRSYPGGPVSGQQERPLAAAFRERPAGTSATWKATLQGVPLLDLQLNTLIESTKGRSPVISISFGYTG